MSYSAARLTLGLVVFVLLGWGVGELWISVAGSVELNAMRDVAAQRTAALTDVVQVITWAGSVFLLVPLALIVCLAFARAGLRREALAVALSLGGAMLISAGSSCSCRARARLWSTCRRLPARAFPRAMRRRRARSGSRWCSRCKRQAARQS